MLLPLSKYDINLPICNNVGLFLVHWLMKFSFEATSKSYTTTYRRQIFNRPLNAIFFIMHLRIFLHTVTQNTVSTSSDFDSPAVSIIYNFFVLLCSKIDFQLRT